MLENRVEGRRYSSRVYTHSEVLEESPSHGDSQKSRTACRVPRRRTRVFLVYDQLSRIGHLGGGEAFSWPADPRWPIVNTLRPP